MPTVLYKRNNDVKYVNSNTNGFTSSLIPNGKVVETKDSLRRSDFIRSTPYYHGRVWTSMRTGTSTTRYRSANGEVNFWVSDVVGPMRFQSPNEYLNKLPVRLNTITDNLFAGRAHIDSSNMINRALSNLRNNKMEMGVMFGEMRTTVGYLAQRGISLISALNEIRKGRVLKSWRRFSDPWRDPRAGNKFRKRVTTASRAWLESRYAIRPLVYDIQSLADTLNTGLDASPIVSGSSKAKMSDVITNTDRVDGWYTQVVREACEYKIASYYKVVGRIDGEKWTAMKQLGLDNPFSVGYELVPFSFMVDWVLPIGDFISAWTGSAGLDFVDAYQSWTCNGTLRQSYTRNEQIGNWSGYRARISGGGLDGGFKLYDRRSFGSFPLPRLPSIENSLDMPKIVDLASITNQLIRKLR